MIRKKTENQERKNEKQVVLAGPAEVCVQRPLMPISNIKPVGEREVSFERRGQGDLGEDM